MSALAVYVSGGAPATPAATPNFNIGPLRPGAGLIPGFVDPDFGGLRAAMRDRHIQAILLLHKQAGSSA